MNISIPRSILRRASSLLLAAALLCALTLPALAADSSWPWCGTTFIIIGIGDHPIVYDGSGPEPDLSGYPLVFMDDGRTRTLGTAARQTLTITHDGKTYTDTSDLEALPAAFRHLGFTASPLESVLVEVSRGYIDVTVASDLVYCDQVVEKSPYETIRQANPAMLEGEEEVVQVGAEGEKGSIYQIAWSNGAELSRQLVEVLDSEPVDEIIEYGTAKPVAVSAPTVQSVSVSRDAEDAGGTLALSDSGTLRFTRAISMTATAYTAGYGGAGARTASGTPVRRGVVAVDPNVIPIGSKLYIVASGGVIYGEAVAEDTGVHGNRIDLYFETYGECISFGRRNCMVYILE